MLDREIVDALVEVGHRISSIAHHAADEAIGVADRGPGRVDETRLDGAPLLGVPIASAGWKGLDLERAMPAFPRRELRFRALP